MGFSGISAEIPLPLPHPAMNPMVNKNPTMINDLINLLVPSVKQLEITNNLTIFHSTDVV